METRTCRQSDIVLSVHQALDLGRALGVTFRASHSDAEVFETVLEAAKRARALLRRDWAVRVLDAWIKAGRSRAITVWDNFTAGVELFDGHELGNDGRKFEAVALDAARHAAALAVWPTLSAEEQARIGECP